MCGIAGLLRYGVKAREDIEVMKDRMIHRGPDSGGTWGSPDGEVYLGHRRLSIMDLSESGSQPMISHSGRFVMVFNGEIYDYKSLEKPLSQKGISDFRSSSDTEYLLEALEHLGIEETLSVIRGMFAVALYDTLTREIVLIRDRIGEKPLYYGYVNSENGKALAFASDLGCIRALSNFDNGINTEILGVYFANGYIPAPHTVYKNIFKLRPGCVLRSSYPYLEENTSISGYWSITDTALKGRETPFKGSFEEASLELERLLKRSISDQMVADVPLGAFLSGGIDSATVVALMQSVSPGSVKSFTIGMDDKAHNEAVFAKEIANHLGSEHTELYINDNDAQKVIPLLPRMFSEPFADSSQIPTYLVSRMTREHVTVSLSGDAGDELFGGYNLYGSMTDIWKKIKNIPLTIREISSDILINTSLSKIEKLNLIGTLLPSKDPEKLYRNFGCYADKIALDRTKKHTDFYEYDLSGDALGCTAKDIMLQDMLVYHPDDILVKVDRCAMAVSLETRVPFLDKDVVEFAWTLPIEYLRSGNRGKLILRDVLYRHVPKELMERPKKGFSIPISDWLKKGDLNDWAKELISEKKIKEQGLIDHKTVNKLWDNFEKKGIWKNSIWSILMFQSWYEKEFV